MKNLILENQKGFVESYLQTAAWVTCEDGENTDFTKEAKQIAAQDCKIFIDKVFAAFPKEKAETLINIEGKDVSFLCAFDFFLTRNRHGAGFWEQQHIYGEKEAAILTKLAEECKEINCYHIRGKRSKLTFD